MELVTRYCNSSLSDHHAFRPTNRKNSFSSAIPLTGFYSPRDSTWKSNYHHSESFSGVDTLHKAYSVRLHSWERLSLTGKLLSYMKCTIAECISEHYMLTFTMHYVPTTGICPYNYQTGFYRFRNIKFKDFFKTFYDLAELNLRPNLSDTQ